MLLIASVLKIIGTVGMSYLTYTSIKNMGMHYEPSYFLSMMMSVLSILGNILFGLGLLLLINAYLKLKRQQQDFV